MSVVVVEPHRLLVAGLIGFGKRAVRLREQAVVEALFQLARLTKPAGTSLSGHLVTYLSCLGLGRSLRRFPIGGLGVWAADPPSSHAPRAPAYGLPGHVLAPVCPSPALRDEPPVPGARHHAQKPGAATTRRPHIKGGRIRLSEPRPPDFHRPGDRE